ncbi:MAG: low affinity iron permease family protein [Planctomycetota bacterium]
MTTSTRNDPPPRSRLERIHRAHLHRARRRALGTGTIGPFRRVARATSTAMGRPWAFCLAILIVVVWGTLGPVFAYSDTWQLVINTGTTIVTFLMVFLIQNTQNRDTEALRLKLDELILATRGARNLFVDIDDLDEKELDQLERDLRDVARAHPDAEGAADRDPG